MKKILKFVLPIMSFALIICVFTLSFTPREVEATNISTTKMENYVDTYIKNNPKYKKYGEPQKVFNNMNQLEMWYVLEDSTIYSDTQIIEADCDIAYEILSVATITLEFELTTSNSAVSGGYFNVSGGLGVGEIISFVFEYGYTNKTVTTNQMASTYTYTFKDGDYIKYDVVQIYQYQNYTILSFSCEEVWETVYTYDKKGNIDGTTKVQNGYEWVYSKNYSYSVSVSDYITVQRKGV